MLSISGGLTEHGRNINTCAFDAPNMCELTNQKTNIPGANVLECGNWGHCMFSASVFHMKSHISHMCAW